MDRIEVAFFGSGDALFRELQSQINDGDFWADRCFGKDHEARLSNAMTHLPLPAAFREAMIALRGVIRERSKLKEDYIEPLKLLYWIAAIASFSMPYSKRLKQPGFNVLCSIPWETLSGLEFAYKSLGYAELGLLKCDIKRLVEAFGEPKTHSTLIKKHKAVWRKYEDMLIAERKARELTASNWLAEYLR